MGQISWENWAFVNICHKGESPCHWKPKSLLSWSNVDRRVASSGVLGKAHPTSTSLYISLVWGLHNMNVGITSTVSKGRKVRRKYFIVDALVAVFGQTTWDYQCPSGVGVSGRYATFPAQQVILILHLPAPENQLWTETSSSDTSRSIRQSKMVYWEFPEGGRSGII